MKESGNSGLRVKTTHFFDAEIAAGAPLYWVKQYGSVYTRAGVPDFLVCYAGLFGGLEIKREGERSTRKQMHELELINARGGLAGWADSMSGVRAYYARLVRVALYRLNEAGIVFGAIGAMGVQKYE